MFKEKTLSFQVELVKSTLERSGHNVTEAARVLGMSRSFLTKFMAKNGIKRQYS
jgi:transcriptional regulator with GAF, ATPase, and Fis domain